MNCEPRARWGGACMLGLCLIARAPSSPAAEPPGPRPDHREAILRELRDVSVEGMSRRLGPDYAYYHGRSATEDSPDIWMAPRRQDPGGRPYQIGGPWTQDAGDYSSTQGQVLYVPDGDGFPVDRVTVIEWAHGCFTEAPLPPWHGGFRPEPASEGWIKAAPGCRACSALATTGSGSYSTRMSSRASRAVSEFSAATIATASPR